MRRIFADKNRKGSASIRSIRVIRVPLALIPMGKSLQGNKARIAMPLCPRCASRSTPRQAPSRRNQLKFLPILLAESAPFLDYFQYSTM
jgi:hypothetical protein